MFARLHSNFFNKGEIIVLTGFVVVVWGFVWVFVVLFFF